MNEIQNTKSTMNVEAKAIKDINENDKYYIILHRYGKRITINTRKNTYNKVVEVMNENQLEINLNEQTK